MQGASCGLDVNSPDEICKVLKLASEEGFEFVCMPLVHPRFKREFVNKWKDRGGPFTRPDLVLKSNEWNSLIAGKISPYISVDSESGMVDQEKFALEQELSYGNHLDVPTVIISLKSSKCSNLARVINSNLMGLNAFQIWVVVPLISHSEEALVWRSDAAKIGRDEKCTWEWWNNFHTLCNFDKRLGLILEMSKTLPSQAELDRWMSEPIKCLMISTSTFLTNKKGYPVLSKAHQAFVKSLVHFDIQVIIKGNNHHYNLACYQKYIDHLWQETIAQNYSKIEKFVTSENIQYPLQPLADNLVSRTYELFEKDSVKYKKYKEAIYSALVNKFEAEEKCDKFINLMVVGAGRGPLVIAALNAATETSRKVKIYAVEKNPYTVVTLQALQEELWQNSVEIISADIRQLDFPQTIDILISDLLGSFGDNELSPEILDGAQKFLKKGGISIPESYTSFLCPVQGSKVYSDLKASQEKSHCEMPYIVMHKNKYNISKPKPLFTFHHPNFSDPINNSRYKYLIFDVKQNCILHGFTGFFEAVLFKEIKLSIVPENSTPGLYTWNPIFFPLQEPVHLKAGTEMKVHFWRMISGTSVWYEWTLSKPIPLPIHNPNGRSSNIGLK